MSEETEFTDHPPSEEWLDGYTAGQRATLRAVALDVVYELRHRKPETTDEDIARVLEHTVREYDRLGVKP